MSTRMMGASWWFFCLIIVSSYTANLAAFLVVETIVRPIKSAEDLAALDGKIKYGAKRGGSTFKFFEVSTNNIQNNFICVVAIFFLLLYFFSVETTNASPFQASNYDTYAKMYQYMEENAADVMTESNDDGKFKVLDINENYAFLMESTSIQYIQQRECNLTQIGGLLDAKGYGIAMRKSEHSNRPLTDLTLCY